MTDFEWKPWSVQIDDLIGGWIVTNYPHPLSEHDHRRDGDRTKFGYIIAECWAEEDARIIATACNDNGVRRD